MAVACPACGSPQPFSRRRRERKYVVEIFISCKACPYESVLLSGPRPVVDLELEVERLRGRVAAGESTLRDRLRARERALERLREDS